MQVAANRPQKVLGAPDLPDIGLCEHPPLHQLADILDLVEVLGDPEQGLQVAKPALPFLDVRLQNVA